MEPINLLGKERFSHVDMRVRVKGGGSTAQIYAIRQAIAKSLVAYYQKYVDEASKKEIKDILLAYDREQLPPSLRPFQSLLLVQTLFTCSFTMLELPCPGISHSVSVVPISTGP